MSSSLLRSTNGVATLTIDRDDDVVRLGIDSPQGRKLIGTFFRQGLLDGLDWGHVEGDGCPAQVELARVKEELQAAFENYHMAAVEVDERQDELDRMRAEKEHLEERANAYSTLAGDRLRELAKAEALLAKRDRQVMALVDMLTKEG